MEACIFNIDCHGPFLQAILLLPCGTNNISIIIIIIIINNKNNISKIEKLATCKNTVIT